MFRVLQKAPSAATTIFSSIEYMLELVPSSSTGDILSIVVCIYLLLNYNLYNGSSHPERLVYRLGGV